MAFKGSVNDEVGVAPDRAGEVRVVFFAQAVVPQRLRDVGGALETLEEADLDGLLVGLAFDGGEELAEIFAFAQIAGVEVVGGGDLLILGEAVGFGILVNAVDRRLPGQLELAGDDLVGEEHELFDELVRFVVLDAFEALGFAVFVEPHFDLGKIEVEGALGEAVFAEERRELPSGVNAFAGLVLGFVLKNGVGLLVSQARGAADNRLGEARARDFPLFINLGEGGEGHAVDVGLEAADPVAQGLGKHRDDSVGEVNAVAALDGFAVELGLRPDVMRDVGDVDGDGPTGLRALNFDGVVEILGVVGIDRDDVASAEVFALGGLFGRDFGGNLLGFADDLWRETLREAVLADDREDVDARVAGATENLDDVALGVDVAGGPVIEFGDDLVAELRVDVASRGGHVEILDEAWVVGDDVEEGFGLLEGADDRLVFPGEDADDAAFGAGGGAPAGARVFLDPGDNAVAVHGGPRVFRADEEIGLSASLVKNVGRAGRMNLDFAGEEVGFLRNDVAVLPDSREVTRGLHCFQEFAELAALGGREIEPLGEFVAVERRVFDQRQDAVFQRY